MFMLVSLKVWVPYLPSFYEFFKQSIADTMNGVYASLPMNLPAYNVGAYTDKSLSASNVGECEYGGQIRSSIVNLPAAGNSSNNNPSNAANSKTSDGIS